VAPAFESVAGTLTHLPPECAAALLHSSHHSSGATNTSGLQLSLCTTTLSTL
jgi:hypothetical protein